MANFNYPKSPTMASVGAGQTRRQAPRKDEIFRGRTAPEAPIATDVLTQQEVEKAPPQQASYADQVRARAREWLKNPNLDQERNARQKTLQQSTEQNILGTNARMGLGGLNISGAGAGAENNARSQGALNETLGMSEFERNARAEEIARTEASFNLDNAVTMQEYEAQMYDAAVRQLEIELNQDINKDGVYGWDKSRTDAPGAPVRTRQDVQTYNWDEVEDLNTLTPVSSDESYDYYVRPDGTTFRVRKVSTAYID